METNDRPLNGIYLNGKFYEAIECNNCMNYCGVCDLSKECDSENFPCAWNLTNDRSYFRFSQSITDKINGK